MPQTLAQNAHFLSGLDAFAQNTQSILDVFVVQGLISPSDAENLKRKYRTNREVEEILLKNRVVTKDTINKAYSILLKLPYISLQRLRIPQDVLGILAKETAIRFKVIPFGLENNILMLAIADPSQLSINFTRGLDKILEAKKLEVETYITGESDFNSAVRQYDQEYAEDLMSTPNYPVIYLRNQSIPGIYLGKFPIDFIQKFRAVVFYRKSDGMYAVAAEDPNDPALKRAIEEIEKNNAVSMQLFATSAKDIDYCIDIYREKLQSPKEPEEKAVKVKIDDKKDVKKEETRSSDDDIISVGSLFSSFSKKDNKNEPAITIDEFQSDKFERPVVDDKLPEKKHKEKEEIETILDIDEPKNDQEAEPPRDKGTEEAQENDQSRSGSVLVSSDEGSKEERDIGSLLPGEILNDKDLKEVITENDVPKTVAAIINFALNSRASDVHVEPEDKKLRIRYRIDGQLIDIVDLPLKFHPPMISRIKILARLKIDESRIPQDGRFDVVFKNREVDVRVSSLPTVHGEKAVLRILDKSAGILSLEDLGLSGRGFDLTVEAIEKPYGVILSCGPTGSGKTTTLYAMINRISKPSVNIVTLEDPVEYEIPGVNQCQVKPQIGFTFAEGLRSVLRQDPNVIMVGEIRDGETAGMATHAALTGHLVLSTLHTNDAAGALPRLINMGVEPFLITSSIDVIIAQRLVRRICLKCRKEIEIPPAIMTDIKKELDAISKTNQKDQSRIPADLKFFHGAGCKECSAGYRGRVGIFEVLNMSEEIEDLAVKRRPANEIKASAIKDGMITMKQDGILKALEGLTTIDEVFSASSS